MAYRIGGPDWCWAASGRFDDPADPGMFSARSSDALQDSRYCPSRAGSLVGSPKSELRLLRADHAELCREASGLWRFANFVSWIVHPCAKVFLVVGSIGLGDR